MDICLERTNEKHFLSCVDCMLKDLCQTGTFRAETLQELETAYAELTKRERARCLDMVYGIFSEDYDVAMYLFAAMLKKLRDKKTYSMIERLLLCQEHSLWKRLNDRCQLRIFLFTNRIFQQEYEAYVGLNRINECFLRELREKMNCGYPYIPYKERRKKIIFIMSDVISMYHAPTKRLRYIYQYYRNMGYEVMCFVCHMWGKEGSWDWNACDYFNNFADETGFFSLPLDGVNIEGFNLILKSEDYAEMLAKTVGMIWNEKPEFVFEIGNETILAGLCKTFTTLVTMGCTKQLPVTNAPIIATAVRHSEAEQALWEEILKPGQTVMEVFHTINTLEKEESGPAYSKETFGLPKDAFVAVIAGNRLDEEVKDSFLAVLYQILDLNPRIAAAVIGECPKLQMRVEKDGRSGSVYFLGMQENFREAVSIGDVFLNPPRQGGGTGALMAVLEEVPVITLDNCDVEANAGEAFVCGSMEEMPSLVRRYFTDQAFMEMQKENCRKAAAAKSGVNSEENFRKLNDAVKQYATGREAERDDTF